MNVRILRRCLAILAAIAVMALPALPAWGDVGISLGSLSSQLELVPTPSEEGQSWTVTVRTTVPVRLTVTVSDAMVDDQGRWFPVDLGSTPYSFGEDLKVTPSSVSLSPSDETQPVAVRLSMPAEKFGRPRAGIVMASLMQDSAGSHEQVSAQQGLATRLTVVSEWTESANPQASLAPDGLSYSPEGKSGPIDALIPDLPGLIDRGPVTMRSTVKNTGEVVLNTTTTFRVASVGPAAILGADEAGTPLYTLNALPRFALPDQIAVTSGSTIIKTDSEARADSLPSFGFVRLSSTTQGTLGRVAVPPVVQSQVVLVAPWKEGLVVLLLLAMVTWFRTWRRRRAVKRAGSSMNAGGDAPTMASSPATASKPAPPAGEAQM